jgi:hypothetical protein
MKPPVYLPHISAKVRARKRVTRHRQKIGFVVTVSGSTEDQRAVFFSRDLARTSVAHR